MIGEAADAAGAAKLVEDRRPDVLVLDLQMPGAEPRQDIPRLRQSSPATAIVVLTMQNDPRAARDLLRAGASGYVLKQAAERQLGEAIRIAAGGGSYVDPELGGAMAKLEADPLESLSERELELLRLVALGLHQPRNRRAALPQRQGGRGQPRQALREAGNRVAPGAGPLRDRQRRHRGRRRARA